MFALESFWQTYIYASAGFGPQSFSTVNQFNSSPGHYDLLTLWALSTSNLRLIVGSFAEIRSQKTKMIADHKLVQEYLTVCKLHGKNCNTCEKCERTLLTLDCLDKLDDFRQVFDVDYYRKNRSRYISNMLKRRKNGDTHSVEVYDMFEREKPGYINQILSDSQ